MKKILFLLVLVFVIACSKQQFVCPDGSVVDDVEKCQIEEEVEEKVQQPEEVIEEVEEKIVEERPKLIIEPKVQELITNANKRSTSMKFLYVGPPDYLPQDTYWVKEDMRKIALLKATDHIISQPYTHVYIDNKKRTATAFCEVQEADRCEALQEDFWELDWNDFDIRSPLDWMNAITGASHEGGGPTFENRKTQRIRFTTQDASGIMNVLDFYSIPGLIIFDDGTEIEFRDLDLIGSVKDEDMAHPAPYPSR